MDREGGDDDDDSSPICSFLTSIHNEFCVFYIDFVIILFWQMDVTLWNYCLFADNGRGYREDRLSLDNNPLDLLHHHLPPLCTHPQAHSKLLLQRKSCCLRVRGQPNRPFPPLVSVQGRIHTCLCLRPSSQLTPGPVCLS